MCKTIAKLWQGRVGLSVKFGSSNSEMKELETLMEKVLEELSKNLAGRSEELFRRYSCNVDEYLTLSNEQAFCDGFCFGTRIAMEALCGAERMIGY